MVLRIKNLSTTWALNHVRSSASGEGKCHNQQNSPNFKFLHSIAPFSRVLTSCCKLNIQFTAAYLTGPVKIQSLSMTAEWQLIQPETLPSFSIFPAAVYFAQNQSPASEKPMPPDKRIQDLLAIIDTDHFSGILTFFLREFF